jgi:hypothetical protein
LQLARLPRLAFIAYPCTVVSSLTFALDVRREERRSFARLALASRHCWNENKLAVNKRERQIRPVAASTVCSSAL